MNLILLIEDDPSGQHVYRTQLEALGHQVVISTSGAMGVMEARTAAFDLFLVDVHLENGIDGYEVCRRLKAIPGTQRVPVVLLSDHVESQEDLHRGYQAGCQSFVVKGDPTGLEDVVRAMLRIKSLQDDLAQQNRVLENQNRRLQAARSRTADLELDLGSAPGSTYVTGTMPRPEGVLLVDEEGIVRLSDRGVREFLGHGIEGRHLSALAPQSRLEAVVRDARSEPHESVRVEFTSRSGGRRSLLVSVFPLVSTKERGESNVRVVLLADGGLRRASAPLVRRGVQGLAQAEWGPMVEALRDAYAPASFLGTSAFAHDLRARLTRLASSSDPVLFQGPTGTGKELAARILHHSSVRSRSFLKLECSAREETLAQDLFGDGAADAVGFLSLAQGGTLVLEDIDLLPLPLQERLVRTLESGSALVDGGSSSERADARLVLIASADLEIDGARWKLHPELYRTVESEHVFFPPLVERVEDTAFLAQHFLRRHALHEGAEFEAQALEFLVRHTWPQNVDGLRDAVRQACARASDQLVASSGLPSDVVAHQRPTFSADMVPAALPTPDWSIGDVWPRGADPEDEGESLLDVYEKQALIEALRRTGGDKQVAAQILGVGKSTFYRKIKLHGITAPQIAGQSDHRTH